MPIPSKAEMELYCSAKGALIRIICRTNQWSGINEGAINDWLFNNFKDVSGRYLAIKILLHSLYYSEENISRLAHYGIYEKIIGSELKKELVDGQDIAKVKSRLLADVRARLKRSLFIPLLNADKPSESGNAIIRLLNNRLSIPTTNTSFHYNVTKEMNSEYSRIIIVDDCLGSGDQLKKFWNSNESFQKFREIFKELPFYYLVLVGYEDSITDLQIEGELQGLKVIVCDKLKEENKIFSDKHTIWNDGEELGFAIDYFNNIEKEYGVPRLGFKNLDFALLLHNTAPDWSLPIFWKETSDWKSLVRRKNSED